MQAFETLVCEGGGADDQQEARDCVPRANEGEDKLDQTGTVGDVQWCSRKWGC